MKSQKRIVKRKNLISQTLGNKTFILNPEESDFIYELNSTARIIWTLISNNMLLQELAKKAGEKLGISDKKAYNEVKSFISDLNKSKLVMIK